MGEVGNIWIKIGAKWDELEKATAAVDKAMVKIGDKFQKCGKDLSIMGGAITATMGLIIAKTANLGDQFYDLSQRTGIAVETLSSFKLAADKSGTSIGGFATGMKGLSRSMADAASGGKESKEAFDALGVSATDSAGNLRPLDQVMLDVADRFAAMENGAEKNALALKLFGKSGMDLIPMLNLGRKGLEENVEQMKKFGIVTTEDARLGDAFNDAMTELQAATGGLTRVIGNALIPAMTSLATKAADIIAKVSAWAREHPLLIKVISGTVLVIGGLLTALGSTAYAIGTVLKHLPTLITGLKVLKAIALNPIAIIITVAIPVLTKALSDFKKEFDNMRAAMEEAGKSGFIGFLEGVNSGWRKVALGIKDSNIVMSEANKKIVSVKGAIILLGEAFRAIKGAIDAGATSVAKIADVFKEFGLKTRTELTEELKKAEAALKLLKGSAEATPGAIKALEDKIVTLKEQLYGARIETEKITETFTPMARGAAFVRDVMQGFSGILTDTFVPAAREMSLIMAAAPGVFDAVGNAASGLEYVFKAIGDAIGASAATVKIAMWNMAADVLAAYGIIIAKMPELATVANTVTTQTKDYFAGLWNDIAIGFGNTVQKWLEGATTFKNFLEGLWDNIKNSFFRMIGQMVTDWLIGLVQPLITGAATAATGVAGSMASIGTTIASLAASVGTVLVTLVTSIGTAIVTLAGAIAGAMVTLATGIASAASIIAAAAPAIIVASLIGLGIYATINLLKRLIGGGASGAGDGMGRVVERQDVQTGLLTMIRDTLNNNIKTALWDISTKLDKGVKDKLVFFNKPVQQIRDHLKTIASKNYLKDVVGYLKSIDAHIGEIGYASGGIAWTPQLAMVAEREPEIIMPLREYRTDATPSAGGRNGPITVNIKPLLIDKKDHYLIEFIQENLDHHVFRVPTAVVGG